MSFAVVIERLQKLENPYPGLRSFEAHESHLFFGRDQQIAELVDRLERHHFVAVVGVSGSGKSSLVRAGLIPALEHGSLGEAGPRWRKVVIRPAASPFASLAQALSKNGLDPSDIRQSSLGLIHIAHQLSEGENLLIAIDQFEELFRYKDRDPTSKDAARSRNAAASEASEFVQLLLATRRHQPPVYIVLTMRSDYLGDCAEFHNLPETLNDCQYLVSRLTREQRKEAIEGPLGRVQIRPSLVQRMLNDAGDEPDQLPILQHALMRTWSHWRRSDRGPERPIAISDYEAIGGFENALNQHADELLEGISPEIAATIFKRLTARGRADRERRDPAALGELWAVCGAENEEQKSRVTAVIDRFRLGEATFLAPRVEILSEDTYVDITHECLIRRWKKLRDEWLPQENKSAKIFLNLFERASNWNTGKGELLRGLDLSEAVDWNRQRNKTAAWAHHYAGESTLSIVVKFIEEGEALERKRAFYEKRNLGIAIALALLFIFLAAVAGYRWFEASRLRTLSVAHGLVSQSQLLRNEQNPDLETAALLATEAMERSPSFEADHAMRESFKLLPHHIARLVHDKQVNAVAFSPDGHYLATGSGDNTARVFKTTNGEEVVRFIHRGPVDAVAFSPDGNYLATGSEDKTAQVFQIATGKRVAQLSHQNSVRAVVFRSDGQYVLTASADKTARVFETATGKEIATLTHQAAVNAAVFSPDGRYVATGSEDKTARVFEVATGKEVARLSHQGTVDAVAFSPNGRFLATGSEDKTARVFEAATWKEVARLSHQGTVDAIAFSPDGRYVATGSKDRTARVFEAATGIETSRLLHQGSVLAVAFSRYGHQIVTGSDDRTARLFAPASGGEIIVPTDPAMLDPTALNQIVFDQDGRYIVTGNTDTTARVFETAGGQVTMHLARQEKVVAVAFSSDGRFVATAADKIARVFDATNGNEISHLVHPKQVLAIALSPDGRFIATASLNSPTRIFDTATGRIVSELPFGSLQGQILAIAFSPDGRFIGIGGQEALGIFEAQSGRKIANLVLQVRALAVTFSPDGRYVAAAAANTLQVFDVMSGVQVTDLALQKRVLAVAFSPDGRYLAIGGEDHTARVFQGEKEMQRMVLDGPVKAIHFDGDGRYLMTVSIQPFTTDASFIRLIKHILSARDLIGDACSRLTRNLTRKEWTRYAPPEASYHKTCPELP